MKSFRQYIAESVHTYNYTIKIAGDIDKNWLNMFKFNLNKFDPIKISDPISTPIQKSPYGFPGIENQPIHIIKCEFRYPATEPMVQQIAQLLGYNVNMVRMLGTSYDDSINSEADGYSNEMRNDPLLTTPEMGSAPGAKEASKAYGDSYLQSIKDQAQDNKIDIPFAGQKTQDAFDPFKPYLADDPAGMKSPMTTVTRPPKPKTGTMA